MDIYIKPVEKVRIVDRQEVYLHDVAEVYLFGEEKAEALPVFHISQRKKKTYLLSVLELVEILHQTYPKASIFPIGTADILIEYSPKKENRSKIWTWCKVSFVATILFIGSATTIMCFHTDVQLPLIFQNIYYLFYGENRQMPALFSIPYSIGLGLGIIIFFNHFSKLSLTEDPTPIEIEMTTYEKEANASVIDYLGKRKGGTP